MIKIVLGDITELTDIDVLVNSANSRLAGGGGVDGAIHYKAGSELLKECKKLKGCKTGEAKITKGYNTNASYIIHAVGPIYYDEIWAKLKKYDQAELLKNAYLNSLLLAKEHNLKRIAFSAISTGIYGYPIEKATKIALETVLSFIKENPEYEITFVLYNEEYFKEYIKQIKDYKIEYITEKLDIKKNGFASLSESIKRFKHNFHF